MTKLQVENLMTLSLSVYLRLTSLQCAGKQESNFTHSHTYDFVKLRDNLNIYESASVSEGDTE
jgi:hypothetical protein